MASGGCAPSGILGRALGQGFRGALPPLKLKHFWLLNVQWIPQICYFFSKNLETQKIRFLRLFLQKKKFNRLQLVTVYCELKKSNKQYAQIT